MELWILVICPGRKINYIIGFLNNMKLDYNIAEMYSQWGTGVYHYGLREFLGYCTDGTPWVPNQLHSWLFL